MRSLLLWTPWILLLNTLLFWVGTGMLYGSMPYYGHPDPKDIVELLPWYNLTLWGWMISPVFVLLLVFQRNRYTTRQLTLAGLGWLTILLFAAFNIADITNWLLD